MITNKCFKNIFLIKTMKSFFLLVFMLSCIMPFGSAYASDTVKVFLMAGQSNMEGNNTKISSLEKLLCHAGEFSIDGENCGNSDIDLTELTPLFLSTVESDYNDAVSKQLAQPVINRLQSFLCKAGRITVNGETCGLKNFDLTDRLFRTVSEYYNKGTEFGYGYDAFKHMTTAMELSEIHNDGLFTDKLPGERSDTSVLMYTGKHDSNGTLSLSERKGALKTNFGAKTDTFGPELLFGHYMGEAITDDILLLKVVEGGTSLRVKWRSPGVEQNTGNNYTADDLKSESLYDKLIEKALFIQQADNLEQLFPQYKDKKIEIAGFVWFQGWNDGCNDTASLNYEINFTNFIQDLKTDLNLPNLPIVVAQSHFGDSDGLVQVAQASVTAATDDMEMCITDDLSGYYHFDSAAHPVIGMRMAETMKPLLNDGGETPDNEWNSLDIGDVGSPGSTISDDGTYTINSSGSDIWGKSDEFRFVYQSLKGDGTIIANVVSLTNTNDWAKAGVMIREALESSSTQISTIVSVRQGIAAQWRLADGENSSNKAVGGSAPYWVQLNRTGNLFTASASQDGETWEEVHSETIEMADEVFMGLCVTAHDNAKICTAEFDNISIIKVDSDINIPEAHGQAVRTNKDTPVEITLTGNDSEDKPLTYEIIEDPENGTLTGNVPDLTYTPGEGFIGSDYFTFLVNNGETSSEKATVEITVLAVSLEDIVENANCFIQSALW